MSDSWLILPWQITTTALTISGNHGSDDDSDDSALELLSLEDALESGLWLCPGSETV